MLGTVRHLVIPVDDVTAAVNYYRDELGLTLRFQDGSRWAAFELGDITVGVAGPGEHPAQREEIALGIKVHDLDAALESVVKAGGEVLEPVRTGEHERRASCRDRFGTLIALYEPLSR